MACLSYDRPILWNFFYSHFFLAEYSRMMTSPNRSVLHKRVNGHLTGGTISFPTGLCPRHEQWVTMKWKGKNRRSASRWCKSGRCDGWQELFVLGAYVLVHIHVLPLERCVVMDERHPLPVQQWKCLKHLGPRDGPCHSPPILVTYGPAMVNTPGLLLWVWICGDGGVVI